MTTEHDLTHQLVRTLDLVITGPKAFVDNQPGRRRRHWDFPVLPIDPTYLATYTAHLEQVRASLREAQDIVTWLIDTNR